MSASAGVVLSPIFENTVHSPSGYFHGGLDLHSNESILIYLTVGGSVVPMRVLESDSIASVKLRIQKCKGFVVKNQKLVFGGRELARNNCLVKDYGITGGKFLNLVLKLSDLFPITVRTICGKEFEVQIDRYRNVGYLKQRIFKEGKGFVDLDQEDKELCLNGEVLEDRRLISDICKNSDAVVHLVARKSAKVRAKSIEKDVELSVVASDENDSSDGVDESRKHSKSQLQVVSKSTPARDSRDFSMTPIIVNPKLKLPSAIWDLIDSTFEGLANGRKPIQSFEGMGGAYFMSDSTGNKYVSVFKPIDEEPMAVNNPRGLPVSSDGEGLKRGTRVGEGAFREVAAYILDHPKNGPHSLSDEVMGFSGVPPTAMVKCLHEGFHHPQGFENTEKYTKFGSLQMFMENEGSCEEMGPRNFPVEEIHKITVLDMRLANADRHAGNILIKKGDNGGQMTLIPIDHGYCLPEKFEDCTFDWLYWPQACQPYSRETVEYIQSLDAEEDIALLKLHGWDIPIECARTLRISTMLLKKGVERGFTPFAIGSIMCRDNINKESLIEEIVHQAQESLLPGMSEPAFLEAVSNVMDHELDKVAK